MQRILNGDVVCPWHGEPHAFGLTVEQMIWARTVEFIESARQLGVDRVFIAGVGGLDDREAYQAYLLFRDHVRDIVWHFESRYPQASHKLISGWHDTYEVEGRVQTNPAHRACWDAAVVLRQAITDFRFYRVYVYYEPKHVRNAQTRRQLTSAWLERKRAALAEYKLFEPLSARYAYGYHSVSELIDNAYNDDTEYFDRIE